MNRRFSRKVLIVALLVSGVFAAWSWFRPYEWNADVRARCRVVGCQVTKDRSNYWVDVHLKMLPGESHDLMKPVRLLTEAGNEIEAADTTLGGENDGGTSDLWFKFWLEAGDAEGPLTLHVNDGGLLIRSKSGAPALGASGGKYFVTNHW